MPIRLVPFILTLRKLVPALLLLTLVCTRGLALNAQTDSLGEWRTLQSYRNGTFVTESAESIIYTTSRAIFYLDKDDLSITTLAKDNGLAEARIRLLRYHQPTETLIIVYESGVIDLLRDGQFSTLRQIDNFNFNGDKSIYSIFFGENNLVYFSAGFGLTALDLGDNTFPFTTFTGVRVNASAEFEGMLYAATNEGLYRVPLVMTNLNDFGSWELLGETEGLPGDYTSTAVNVFKGRLYFGIDKDLYRLTDGMAPELIYAGETDRDYRIQYLSPGPSLLLAGYRCVDDSSCDDRQILYLNEDGLVDRKTGGCFFLTNYALEDDRGRIWYGEAEPVSEIRYVDGVFGSCNRLEYLGPDNDRAYDLLHDGTSLWVAPGVRDANFTPSFDFDGVYRLRDGSWTSYKRSDNDAFLGRDGNLNGDDDVATIVSVDYDPVNDVHYFSSFFEGLIAFDAEAETGEFFDESNSSLTTISAAGPSRVRVAGTATDAAGFTYAAMNGPDDDNIVSVRSPDGQWADLGGGCSLNTAQGIAVDQSGFVWVIHASSLGGGITVLDVNGTPMDASDDRCRTFNASNSELPTNNIRSIAVDLDGAVWIGTSEGITIFSCGNDVFNAERCRGELPIIGSEDGFLARLLATEEVLSIAVDGGNRKWIGTGGGGVYLVAPTGREQLLNFTAGNSPLLDNIVRSIAIDGGTGTVYFGTELGINSYRAEATAAGRTFREALTVFPNPVEPGYAGPIAIQGLARDARVKITDLSGKLVDEGTAAGGQYIWDGADYTGRRVQTGVYLIFASSNFRFGDSDPGSAVGKIVFIR